jgi:membrane-associated protein
VRPDDCDAEGGMTGFIENLLDVPALVAYVVIGALAFGEAAVFIGFVLPGETAAILGGVLAASNKVDLWILLILVPLAAILGDSVGYEVGHRYGPRVLASRPMRSHQHRLASAQTFLRERGGWAVFIGRFTAFLRAVTPGLAGLSRMPYRRFLVFNALGGIVWGVGAVLLGYFAGNSYAAVEKTVGRASGLLLVLLIVAALVVWHVRRRAREAEAETATETEADPTTLCRTADEHQDRRPGQPTCAGTPTAEDRIVGLAAQHGSVGLVRQQRPARLIRQRRTHRHRRADREYGSE